jgi:hypothetical protein
VEDLMTELAQIKMAVLSALDQFGERAVWDDNVFRAARLKLSPRRLPRTGYEAAVRELQAEGAVAGALGALGQTAWRITATGRALLAELLP